MKETKHGYILLALLLCGTLLCPGFGDAAAQSAKAAQARGKKAVETESPQLKALIVTGQDHPAHNWHETTPALVEALTADPRIEVRVVEDPHFLDSPSINRYDVIVLHFMNWQEPAPGERAQTNLQNFIRSGKGLVMVHFACGAFQEWPPFLDIAGRIWDPSLRGHDKFGPFMVNVVSKDHPITKDMKDFETTDELYTCLQGDVPVEPLAKATSNVDHKDHMMAFVHPFGQGRVFLSTLGHNADAIRVPAVSELFRRGTAWAGGIPVDMPAK